MRWCRYSVVCALLLAAAAPAPAGIFGRRQKADPAQRVPELVKILEADLDDRKRVSAAEELRQFDPGQFPQIVPALIARLQTDPKPAVRSESAHTLGKLRPLTLPAGQALERAAGHDHSLRVRLQARTALMFYHMAGYGSLKKGEPPIGPKPGEPPLAKTGEPPAGKPSPSPFAPPPTAEPPLGAPQTGPPPVAPPPTAPPPPMPVSAPSLYRPLPPGPTPSPLTVSDEGPVLAPPP